MDRLLYLLPLLACPLVWIVPEPRGRELEDVVVASGATTVASASLSARVMQ